MAVDVARPTGQTGKRVGQMAADEAAWRDRQVITVRCALCPDWSYTGVAVEARERAAEHRLEAHPKAERERRTARVANEKRIESLRNKDALRLMDDGLPQDAPAERRPRTQWTEERAIARAQDWTRDHGGPPSISDCTAENDLPGQRVSTRLFGSHSKWLIAAGVERPKPFSRPEPADAAVPPPIEPADPQEPVDGRTAPDTLVADVEAGLALCGPGPIERLALDVVPFARAVDDLDGLLSPDAIEDVREAMDELARGLTVIEAQ